MSWRLKEKQRQILLREQGAIVYPPGSRHPFALVYPNLYRVGMSNLGFHIIYQQINSRGDTACERVFLPDCKDEQEHIRTNTPVFSIENQRDLYEFPLIGFAVSFEMDYFNILTILKLGRVALLAADRNESDAIVIAGGPCSTFNPEPMAAFFDAFIIGEGEDVIHEFLDTYYAAKANGCSREAILLKLAQIPGIYVPRFYRPIYNNQDIIVKFECDEKVPPQISRRWIKNLQKYPGHTVIVTDDTEFNDMYLIEIARGCGRHCRFCMAGYCFRNPRVRSLAQVEESLRIAANVRKKIGLVGAAVSDYPEIDKLCAIIIEQGMSMSVASLRADTLTPQLVEALVVSGHRTITLAPEAASEKLRAVINKGLTYADLENAVTMAVKAGIPNVRLYLMVGLPFEDETDIEAIITMAVNIKKKMVFWGSKGKLTLSINPFIPKPFTPFQWLAMEPLTLTDLKIKKIRTALKKVSGIEIIAESTKEAYVQAALARGNRRLADVLIVAHEMGGFRYWRQAMKQCGQDDGFHLYRERSSAEILPWSLIDVGVEPRYLYTEFHNAEQQKYTPPCQAGCRRCGVC